MPTIGTNHLGVMFMAETCSFYTLSFTRWLQTSLEAFTASPNSNDKHGKACETNNVEALYPINLHLRLLIQRARCPLHSGTGTLAETTALGQRASEGSDEICGFPIAINPKRCQY